MVFSENRQDDLDGVLNLRHRHRYRWCWLADYLQESSPAGRSDRPHLILVWANLKKPENQPDKLRTTPEVLRLVADRRIDSAHRPVCTLPVSLAVYGILYPRTNRRV